MKKATLTLIAYFIINYLNAQIIYESSVPNPNSVYPMGVAYTYFGEKYYKRASNYIYLYNSDFSIYKSISLTFTPPGEFYLVNVSESIFDPDSLVEYLIYWYDTLYPIDPMTGYYDWRDSKVEIYKENGTLLFSEDSSYINNLVDYDNDSHFPYIDHCILPTSSGLKLVLDGVSDHRIYALPGTMPYTFYKEVDTVYITLDTLVLIEKDTIFQTNKDTVYFYTYDTVYQSTKDTSYIFINDSLFVFNSDTIFIFSIDTIYISDTTTTGKIGITSTSDNYNLSIYPNPSNETTTIEYQLPQGVNNGELLLYDLNSDLLRKYSISSWSNSILINNSELQSGAYFCILITSEGVIGSKKMLIIK